MPSRTMAQDAAIEFVLDLQTRRGEVIWAKKTDGTPWSYALLTGSSSISHSLRCDEGGVDSEILVDVLDELCQLLSCLD